MQKKIRKAVIPAAGLGTRFLPATKAIPKEMLPIVDKPIIQYIVEELVDSGIEQVIIISGWHKRTIEDHFDYPFELEYYLKESGKEALFEAQRKIADAAEFVFIRQHEPLGTGHAILQARSVIGAEPFIVHWGDDVIDSQVPAAKQLMDVYERYEKPILAVERVSEDEISNYGAVDAEDVENAGGINAAGRVYRVRDIVEKPAPDETPSMLGQVAEFILTPDFFDRMERVGPGKQGEIWHIDAIQEMAREDEVYACEFEGTRYDCGRKSGYLRANVDFALKRKDVGPELSEYLKSAVCE